MLITIYIRITEINPNFCNKKKISVYIFLISAYIKQVFVTKNRFSVTITNFIATFIFEKSYRRALKSYIYLLHKGKALAKYNPFIYGECATLYIHKGQGIGKSGNPQGNRKGKALD